MISHGLNYGVIMQRALRGVMADALSQVEAFGLPDDHHFYITYDTTHEGALLPDWLALQHPDQITIVLQHEFSDLKVSPDGFSVSMSFSSRRAEIYVPFDAVLTFVDPSVEFGLKFDATVAGDTEEDETADEPDPDAEADGQTETGSADVVSLDQFRKS